MIAFRSLAMSVAIPFLLIALILPATSAAKTLRFGGNFPVSASSSKAMVKFKKEIEKKEIGLKVNLFPAMQLGGAGQNVDQVRSGSVFGTWIGISYLSRVVPQLQAVSLPFEFKNQKQAFKPIDGNVGKLFDKLLKKKGFVVLGYMALGFRNVTNNVRPIKTADDLKGLKIRLQPNKTQIETFRALGANPVAMDISEVYNALQQGVVDGEENPYTIINTRHFNEVQKYLSDTRHFFSYILVLANKQEFDGLSSKQQKAIMSAMHNATEWQREQVVKKSKLARKELIKKGMIFTHISDKERAKMRARVKSVRKSLEAQIGSKVINEVQEEARN